VGRLKVSQFMSVNVRVNLSGQCVRVSVGPVCQSRYVRVDVRVDMSESICQSHYVRVDMAESICQSQCVRVNVSESMCQSQCVSVNVSESMSEWRTNCEAKGSMMSIQASGTRYRWSRSGLSLVFS